MKLMCGIYMIKNLVNGKVYIGSSKDIKRRWSSHKSRLKNNYHHNCYLQNAYNKYKKENFKLEILEEFVFINNVHLKLREQFYFDKYKCYEREYGYNQDPTANRTTISEETKKKLSIIQKNRSPEINAKISAAHKGHITSSETKAKISASNKGRKHSLETKKKISVKSKKYWESISKEQKEKRLFRSPEMKVIISAKISTAKKGIKHSPETCAKISATKRQRNI